MSVTAIVTHLVVSDLTFPYLAFVSGRIPIGMQLLPSAIFTVGLFFLPESPRFLAFQQISEERQRRAQGLTVPSRFPVDESTPHSLKDAELFTPTPGFEREGCTSYLTADSSNNVGGGEATYSYMDLQKPRANHLFGELVNLLLHGKNSKKDQHHHAFAPMYTLAYLRNEPMSAPSIKAEMAEIYAQLDEIEEDRLQGRTSWRALWGNPSVRRRFAVAGFIGTNHFHPVLLSLLLKIFHLYILRPI